MGVFVPESYDWGPGMRIADLILRGGEQRAALLARRGQTSAEGWNNIGQILGGALIAYPRAQREEAHAKLYDAETKAKTEATKRLSDRETKLFALFSDPNKPPRPEDVMTVDPVRGPEIVAGLSKLEELKRARGQEALKHLPAVARGFMAATDTPAGRAALWTSVMRPSALATGLWKPENLPEEWQPGVEEHVVKFAKGYQEPQKPIELPPNTTALDPESKAVIYTTPPAPTPAQRVEALLRGKPAFVNYDPRTQRYTDATGADVTKEVTPKPTAATVIQTETRDNVKDIAAAIIDGTQPPDTRGMYRLTAPIRAELARQGYDLRTAQLDWAATQRHIATLNGPQQTRLNQAITTAIDSLDVIRSLADRWDAGRFPTLNWLQLRAAKSGILGAEAQSIATQLEAQITDVTSELGNAYMGGNSPTDHALKLASKNMSADWSKKTLLDALDLAEKNLTIRRNSMIHSRPAGLSTPEPDRPRIEAIGRDATPAMPEEEWSRDANGQLVRRSKPTPIPVPTPMPVPTPTPAPTPTPVTSQSTEEEWVRDASGRLVRRRVR